MNEEEKIRNALEIAHEHDREAAPSFEDTMGAAEASGGPNKIVWAVGLSGAALAAAAVLTIGGFVAIILLYAATHNPPRNEVAQTTPAQTTDDEMLAEGEIPEADLLDWRPQTDQLLASDDLLEPPQLGDTSWDGMGTDWNEITDEELEEL